ncbi:MAG: sigma-70 family RNA polymerase sigma factor [Chloroflexi bacterium]|nr:sigma-70 family RNA polymerase sigma factor [Chloroflexota bacterium]
MSPSRVAQAGRALDADAYVARPQLADIQWQGRDASMKTAFERYREGEPAAFHEVVSAYAAAAYSVATTVLGDRGLAEQTVEDAFVLLSEDAFAFDAGGDDEEAWILARVRERALRLLRENGRYRSRREPPPEAAWAAARQDEVWRSVMAAATPRMVRGVLESLTEAQRETLALAFWKGLSPAEIARIRGVPEAGVRANLRLGLERVRDALARRAREVSTP